MSVLPFPLRQTRPHPATLGRARAAESERESMRADAYFFRAQTMAIVRHFFEISLQVGRLPSILGREFFRSKVSHHGVPSFEDQVVFVHDVGTALARLSDWQREVIALVGLYQYSLNETAAMVGCSRSWVAVRFARALDRLAEIFLETGLLREERPDRRPGGSPCGETAGIARGMGARKKPAARAAGSPYYGAGGLQGETPVVGRRPMA